MPKPRLRKIQVPLPDEIIEEIVASSVKSGETVAGWVRGAIAARLKTKLPPLVQGRPPLESTARK